MTDHLPDDELVDMLLNGHCAAYALAAARTLRAAGETGVGVTILFDDEGEPNTPDDRCAIHAYASCDRFDADAGGVRGPNVMADSYDLNSHSIDGPFHEDEFAEIFCGEDGLDLDEHWIGASLDLIRRRPDLLEA